MSAYSDFGSGGKSQSYRNDDTKVLETNRLRSSVSNSRAQAHDHDLCEMISRKKEQSIERIDSFSIDLHFFKFQFVAFIIDSLLRLFF